MRLGSLLLWKYLDAAHESLYFQQKMRNVLLKITMHFNAVTLKETVVHSSISRTSVKDVSEI